MVSRVEIVLDFVCAFSYLGFTRLRVVAEQLRSGGADVGIDISPHQLRPQAPDVPEPIFEVHRRDRGEEFARQVRTDRSLGRDDGLTFRFDRALFVNTERAHRLAALAGQQGLAESMTERLFRAYFTDGLDIADLETLRDLARRVGADPAQPWPDISGALKRNSEAGVTDTPVFRFPNGTVLAGEQTTQTLHDALSAS